AEVRAALREAQGLSASDPARALEGLKKTLGRLEEDATLDPDRRDRLAKLVKDRIRVTEALARRPAEQPDPRPAAPRRPADPARQAEVRQLSRDLEAIRSLQRDGRTDEARRQADELAR